MKVMPHKTITIEFDAKEAYQIREFLFEKLQGQFLNDKFKGCKPLWDLYDNLNFIDGGNQCT